MVKISTAKWDYQHVRFYKAVWVPSRRRPPMVCGWDQDFQTFFCFDSTASRPMGARTHAGLPHRFFQRIPRAGFGSRAAWAGNIHSCQKFSWFVPKVWHEHDKTWWNQRLLSTEFPQNLMGQNLRLLSIRSHNFPLFLLVNEHCSWWFWLFFFSDFIFQRCSGADMICMVGGFTYLF